MPKKAVTHPIIVAALSQGLHLEVAEKQGFRGGRREGGACGDQLPAWRAKATTQVSQPSTGGGVPGEEM